MISKDDKTNKIKTTSKEFEINWMTLLKCLKDILNTPMSFDEINWEPIEVKLS